MNCFNIRNNQNNQPLAPPGFEDKKLFPKYKVIKPNNSTKHQIKETLLEIADKVLENDYYSYSSKYPWIKVKCFELSQPKGKYVCIKVINKNAKNSKKIIIFSNGETSNICGILPILVDLSSYLRLSIITYEYPKVNPGQGIFKKEQDMLECVLTVTSYVYASEEYNNLILMGYSTGVYLNYKIIEILINKSKKFVNKLKNVINISPMWCFDPSYTKKIFHNRKYSIFTSNLIKNTNLKLKISTFVSHGVKDDKIGYMISMKICSRLNFVYQWYPKEGDHYNILLKDTFRRKLYTRLQKFLSVNDISIGSELDNSVISILTNKGIKVNITKEFKDLDLNCSSGNFFFSNEEKEKKYSDSKVMSVKGKYKKKGNKNNTRKESGFSFLDISIQKFIDTNDIEDSINEIKDEEEDFDKDDNDEIHKNNILYDDENEKDNENKNNINDNNNTINISNINNNINNNIINNNDKNGDDKKNIIEVVSSYVTDENNIKYDNNFENYIEQQNKKSGSLINDSFGYIAPLDKGNEESSFRISFGNNGNY